MKRIASNCARADGRNWPDAGAGSAGKAALHRHGRHRWHLLSAARRLRQHSRQGISGRHRDRRGDRRLGRQHEADRLRQGRRRLHPGRCRLGRRQRPRQVHLETADPRPRRDVSQPHARRHGRRQRHREDRGPQGQARLDRLAGQRHRGLRLPRHRGGGPRQGQGHDARAPRRGRIRQRAEGQARSTRSSSSAACRLPPSPISRPHRTSR